MKGLIILGENGFTGKCAYCGKVDELRPYGRNGAAICFSCGMRPENKELTEAASRQFLSGKDNSSAQ